MAQEILSSITTSALERTRLDRLITPRIIQSSRKYFLLLADEYRQPVPLYNLTQGPWPWDFPRLILVNWSRLWELHMLESRSRRSRHQQVTTQGLDKIQYTQRTQVHRKPLHR